MTPTEQRAAEELVKNAPPLTDGQISVIRRAFASVDQPRGGRMKFQFSNPVRPSFRVDFREVKRPNRVTTLAAEIQIIRVEPRVWAAAMKLADNDAPRIEVVHSGEVVVHNSRDWRQ